MKDKDYEVLSDVPSEIKVGVGKSVYFVHDMGGEGLSRWTAFATENVGAGRRRGGSLAGMHARLIALCLRDEAGKPVPEAVIANWPAKAQQRLFEICQRHNGLAAGDEEGKV